VHEKFKKYKAQKALKWESEKDQEWCVELQFLALEYLRSYFVFDFLAAVPSMLGLLFSVPFLRFFRIFRVLRLGRLMRACDQLSENLSLVFIRSQIAIQNANLILKATFKLSFLIHFSVCFFVVNARYVAFVNEPHKGMLEVNNVT